MQNCCENDRCDLAVFKNNGTSRGNRNCYFVHCGVDENCLLVGQSHFTAVSIKKGNPQLTVVNYIIICHTYLAYNYTIL